MVKRKQRDDKRWTKVMIDMEYGNTPTEIWARSKVFRGVLTERSFRSMACAMYRGWRLHREESKDRTS